MGRKRKVRISKKPKLETLKTTASPTASPSKSKDTAVTSPQKLDLTINYDYTCHSENENSFKPMEELSELFAFKVRLKK